MNECIDNTITMRLEGNNFNAIDKKEYEDWINWLDVNHPANSENK